METQRSESANTVATGGAAWANSRIDFPAPGRGRTGSLGLARGCPAASSRLRPPGPGALAVCGKAGPRMQRSGSMKANHVRGGRRVSHRGCRACFRYSASFATAWFLGPFDCELHRPPTVRRCGSLLSRRGKSGPRSPRRFWPYGQRFRALSDAHVERISAEETRRHGGRGRKFNSRCTIRTPAPACK